MDRLADFALDSDREMDSYNSDLNIFQMFRSGINRIIEEKSGNMELKRFLDLEVPNSFFCPRFY